MANFRYVFRCLLSWQHLLQQWTYSSYAFSIILMVSCLPWIVLETVPAVVIASTLFAAAILTLVLPLENFVTSDQQTGWLSWYLANYDDAPGYYLAKIATLIIIQILPLLFWLSLILTVMSTPWLQILTILQAVAATGLIVVLWGTLLLLVIADPSLQGKSTLTLFLLLPFLVPNILISYRQFNDMMSDGQFHYYGYQWGLVLIAFAAATALSPLILRQTEA